MSTLFLTTRIKKQVAGLTLLMTLLFMLPTQIFADIHSFKLKNGLKILVKEDHRAPVAISMIWYNVGSSDEPGGLTGLSHALEHMMFKGTPQYPLGVFSKTIAAQGGEENAFTHYDYTAYYEKITSNQIETCLKLEADRMEHLLLEPSEFNKEIKVIAEERRLRVDDNPQALTFERYLATAHLTPPYNHPIIGWMTDIKQLHVDDLKTWYNQFYAPNNATLVVVGDVDPKNIYRLATEYFGKISKQSHYQRQLQAEPPQLGSRLVNIHAPAQLPLLSLGYLVPSATTAKMTWEPYALEIIAAILDGGESGRLNKHLIHQQQLASSIQANYSLYSRYQTQFVFLGIPSQNHSIKDLKSGLLNEIKQLQTTLTSSEELERVKTQIIAQKTFEKDSIFTQAMELGLLETIGLGWQSSTVYIDKINAITPQQIQEVANRYFNNQTITEARLIPIRSQRG